ncbi:M1 family metallopeptidase [Tundrisphaera sp. TA3]|uniref:M1 family metallopeptidase n=1 Tax=Tundrisphaera sp. TA3 TaxID=3435775 RepID=UPI003EBABE72
MRFRKRVGFAGILLGASLAMGHGIMRADEASPADRDGHSFSRPEEVQVRDLDLDLTVDFDRKELRGTATLGIERPANARPDAPLILDVRGPVIEEVAAGRDGASWAPVEFDLSQGDAIRGQALTIPLPPGADRVRIRYRTRPDAGALQWLDPARTAGKAHPFLFTQSQAIQARTWIPIQDTPGVRFPYTATIRVPSGLKAVMAADHLPADADPTVFRFAMRERIPAYLVALAVGDLAFRPLGKRTGVYAEPSMVEKAAAEFADTEAMIEATEERFGPYRWGRYDLLVLPPSFPFGGMENPKLTFATPTILAGDRSLVSLVAHELAHSWSGNLVTNATWRDFWLNEGFTVYLERRIIEAVYGPDRAKMEALLGFQELGHELAELKPADQILHINLDGRDPDDGMTRVPYEKGALFLSELERVFGRDRFDAFLKGYFDRHAFQSITTAVFVADLRDRLFPLDPEKAAKIDLDAWIEAPGLKAAFVAPTSDRLDAVDRAAKEWIEGKTPASRIAVQGWTTQEWLRFLRALPAEVGADRLGELDAAFGITRRENSEIAAEWLVIAIRNRYAAADDRLEAFLTSIGRRKFILPIYAELIRTPEGAERARAIYAKARPAYHPIAIDSVDRLLSTTNPVR